MESLWAIILAVASAVVLFANAAEKISKAVQHAKAPNARQDDRLISLEEWKKSVDRKLGNDNIRMGIIEDGNRVTQRALLALLDHALDGNNIDQMKSAKEELRNHLINR